MFLSIMRKVFFLDSQTFVYWLKNVCGLTSGGRKAIYCSNRSFIVTVFHLQEALFISKMYIINDYDISILLARQWLNAFPHFQVIMHGRYIKQKNYFTHFNLFMYIITGKLKPELKTS